MKNGVRSVGVIGLGRFGKALASELAGAGVDVLAVDEDENAVREIRAVVDNAYVSSCADEETLQQMGFADCDVVCVCIGNHIETSLLVVLHLQNIGVKNIIAKASSADHGRLLEKLGVEVTYPERDMGINLARQITSKGLLESISLSTDVDIVEVLVPARMVGRMIRESGMRSEYHLNIIAIRRDKELLTPVAADDVLKAEDVLLLIGNNRDIHRLLNAK